MVVGEHEHLGLASQSTKGCVVQDAVAVAFVTGAERVGFFGKYSLAGPRRLGGQWCQLGVLEFFAPATITGHGVASARPRVGMGHGDARGAPSPPIQGRMPCHGGSPTLGPFGRTIVDLA